MLEACKGVQKTIDATKLPAQWNTDLCPVGDRIIEDAGGVGSVLPPRGTSVYVEALTSTGAQELTINHSRNGAVEIEDVGAEARGAEPSSGGVTALGSRSECSDRAHLLSGWRVYRGLQYSLNKSTTPRGITRLDAERAVRRGENTINHSHNACRMGDQVPVGIKYAGNTSAKANIGSGGACLKSDKKNVISFGKLPYYLGLTCSWYSYQQGGLDKVTEFDIMFDKSQAKWTSNPGTSSCRKRYAYDVQSTATHEFGHVYGLDHPSGEHPNLTMNWSGDSCDASARTLGRGDVLGLKKIY